MSNELPEIKILIAYHKEAPLLQGDDFLCVRCGQALSNDEILPKNIAGDNVGENISEKNPSYNELTAVYWAWKNLDADYYGLMHYRRHFYFASEKKKFYTKKKLEENYAEEIGYSSKKLRGILANCDFVAPKPISVKSVYKQYVKAHGGAHLDRLLEIIDKDYPDYSETALRYLHGNRAYFGNMFIFGKEIFFRYCNFIFGILERLEKDFVGERMFISERITGIFIEKLLEEGLIGRFLPIVQVFNKQGIRKAIRTTKQNLKSGACGSKIYAFKPLIEELTPMFIIRAYRNRNLH